MFVDLFSCDQVSLFLESGEAFGGVRGRVRAMLGGSWRGSGGSGGVLWGVPARLGRFLAALKSFLVALAPLLAAVGPLLGHA